jgi:hypothetical protein
VLSTAFEADIKVLRRRSRFELKVAVPAPDDPGQADRDTAG